MGGALYCIFVAYDRKRTHRALGRLQMFLAGLDGWSEQHLIIVENAAVGIDVKSGFRIVTGSNRYAEFSAWQEGLELIAASLADEDAVLFVNDTAFENRIFCGLIEWNFHSAINALVNQTEPVLLGETMRTRGAYAIDGVKFEWWVSTYMFFLNMAALRRLQFKVLEVDAFAVDAAESHLISTRISTDLAVHINRYLLTKGPRSWHRAAALRTENRSIMTLKAGCIINEMALSVAACAAGIEVRDIFRGHWLRKRLRTLQHFLIELPCSRLLSRASCLKG